MGERDNPEIEITEEKIEKHTLAFSFVKKRKFALLNTTISYFN